MDLDALIARLNAAFASGHEFDCTVLFDFGDEGQVFIDGPSGKAVSGHSDADAVVRLTFDDFKRIAKGELDYHQAIIRKRVRLTGNVNVAFKLKALLENMR